MSDHHTPSDGESSTDEDAMHDDETRRRPRRDPGDGGGPKRRPPHQHRGRQSLHPAGGGPARDRAKGQAQVGARAGRGLRPPAQGAPFPEGSVRQPQRPPAGLEEQAAPALGPQADRSRAGRTLSRDHGARGRAAGHNAGGAGRAARGHGERHARSHPRSEACPGDGDRLGGHRDAPAREVPAAGARVQVHGREGDQTPREPGYHRHLRHPAASRRHRDRPRGGHYPRRGTRNGRQKAAWDELVEYRRVGRELVAGLEEKLARSRSPRKRAEYQESLARSKRWLQEFEAQLPNWKERNSG